MSTVDSPLRDRMVFVVGAPRSGTYWVQRIISAHPRISAVPNETQLFSHGIAPLCEHFHHGAKASLGVGASFVDRADLIARLRELCDTALAPHLAEGAELLSERSALHALHLDLIGEIYPDAHVVHVIRDGRDVARSMLGWEWGPTTIEGAALAWRDCVRTARRDAPPRYHELRYERLLADPSAQSEALYAALGLAPDAEAIEAAAEDAAVHVNIGRMGSPEGRSHGLPPDQIAAVERVAGDLLDELSYPRDREPGFRDQAAEAVGSVAGHARSRAHRLRLRLASLGRRLRPSLRSSAGAARGAERSFNRLLESVHTGRLDDIGELLSDNVRVRVVSAERDVMRQGEAGMSLLRETAAEDPFLRARQTESHVYPLPFGTAGVLAYKLEDGEVARRVVVVGTLHDRAFWVALHQLTS